MIIKLKSDERQGLVEAARAVALMAYAPYSDFRVGAAVLGDKGLYCGTNIENASYPLGLCAERSALSAAIAAGDKNIRAIAVACIDAPLDGPRASLFPCGACRQWMIELAPRAVVIIGGIDEEDFTAQDLLPHAFRLADKQIGGLDDTK